MSVLAARNVSKSYGGKLVIEEATFQIESGDHVGIVGQNGAGKSTLFKLILGFEEPDSGEVSRQRDASLGHLEQHSVFDADHGVLAETLTAFSHVYEMESELRQLETWMADDPGAERMEKLMVRHAEKLEAFERAGGYALRHKAEAILLGLGIPNSYFDKPVRELSGGESGRIALAKLLLTEPDVLLLDEPTNHLDIAGCEWLEDYLQRFPGAYLVISHDRYFLDKVTNKTLEIAHGEVVSYGVSYSQFEVRKVEEFERARKMFREQQDFLRKEREFIRKNMGSQRTKEAKGRLRRLERLERLEAPDSIDPKNMKLSLESKRRLGNDVIRFEETAVGYDGVPLLQGLDLEIEKGERIGIVGPNGAGKSTLLRALVGELDVIAGSIHLGETVEFGFYDQQHRGVDTGHTAHEEIAAVDLHLTDLQIRSYLARFLLGADDVDRRITTCSGGERGKIALAKILLQRPNVLILDEPTNHLDIPSRTALELALKEYGGTIVCVSHDRYFLDKICDRILELHPEDGPTTWWGNYSVARAARLERDALRAAKVTAEKPKRKRREKERPKGPKPRRVEDIEADIMAREEEKKAILASMESPDIYLDAEKLADCKRRLEEAETALARLEEEWEDHM